MTELDNLAIGRIEHLVTMAKIHRNRKNNTVADMLIEDAQTLAVIMDGDGGDDVLWMRYHRYASDSFGVVFELEHNDPELMFGGV